MNTFRTALILSGLFLLTGFVAYGYSLRGVEGASLMSSHASDRLLGHGVWRFNFQSPRAYTKSYSIGLQIRRLQVPKSISPTPSLVSVEVAEEILHTAGLVLGDNHRTGTVAIQIAGTGQDSKRLLFLGGLQMGGSSSKLNGSDEFFVGRLSRISTDHQPRWRENELQFMRILSETDDAQYIYDVVLEIRDQPISR